jgi:hypothetical protein
VHSAESSGDDRIALLIYEKRVLADALLILEPYGLYCASRLGLVGASTGLATYQKKPKREALRLFLT